MSDKLPAPPPPRKRNWRAHRTEILFWIAIFGFALLISRGMHWFGL